MACGYSWVYLHLQGAKMSLKVSGGGICWWDLDCKGTRASAAFLVSLPFTQLTPVALSSQNQGLNFTASLTMRIIIHLNFRVLRLSTHWKVFSGKWIAHRKAPEMKSEGAEQKNGLKTQTSTWEEPRSWHVEFYFTL